MAACILAGCASWPKHGLIYQPPRKLRIIVLPVKMAVRVKEPQKITEEMTQSLSARLNATATFEVVPSTQVEQALDVMGVRDSSRPLTTDQIKTLGQALDARGVLTTQISGYGKIKGIWLFYLIGSGLIEGAVQGVIVAKAAGSTWAAVGVAVEEVAQETLTWGGGAFLFNKIFTPVILESKLVSTADGQTVWSETAMGRINRKGLKKFPKAERKRKELRLALAAEMVQEELVESLEKKAKSSARP